MKKIKEIIKKDKALVFTILVLITACIYWTVQNNNLKVSLKEANKPSSIEIANNKLKSLESEWRVCEDKKVSCINTIKAMDECKIVVEPKIQEQRQFILWL